MLLQHFKTVSALRHWLSCIFSIMPEFIFLTSCLITFTSSFFGGFIKRYVGLERKLSLWSLSVTKVGALAMRSTLSLILSMVDMLFASRLIEASSLCIVSSRVGIPFSEGSSPFWVPPSFWSKFKVTPLFLKPSKLVPVNCKKHLKMKVLRFVLY